jgi:hypothetical protein
VDQQHVRWRAVIVANKNKPANKEKKDAELPDFRCQLNEGALALERHHNLEIQPEL